MTEEYEYEDDDYNLPLVFDYDGYYPWWEEEEIDEDRPY